MSFCLFDRGMSFCRFDRGMSFCLFHWEMSSQGGGAGTRLRGDLTGIIGRNDETRLREIKFHGVATPDSLASFLPSALTPLSGEFPSIRIDAALWQDSFHPLRRRRSLHPLSCAFLSSCNPVSSFSSNLSPCLRRGILAT